MYSDPKHTSKLLRKWLKDDKDKVLDRPSQSPDLSHKGNFCTALKRHVHTRGSKKLI